MSVASASLRSAAIAGLFGLAGLSCGTPEDGSEAETDPGEDGDSTQEPVVLSVVVDEKIKFVDFQADCTARGGIVQTHAACSGNNACRGLSFNKYSKEMMEHTCKAMNSCGGVSCVVLPEDRGRTADEVWSESCGGCHGGEFALVVDPSKDLAEAEADFRALSDAKMTAIIAFGVRGLNENGTSFAHMPGFHEQFSLAEIGRLVAAVRSKELTVEAYGVIGQNEDMN